MRSVHPRPRRPHASRLERIVEHVARALHDDARTAVNMLRLYPGAPVVDPHTGDPVEGWTWARRHLTYGATEALFLLDENEELLAAILPPSLSSTGTWLAEVPASGPRVDAPIAL